MDVPLLEVDRVYHVGSMDPRLVGENSPRGSQEGDALSVSVCPNAWMDIAEIGGDCHEMTRAGGLFVDVHAIAADPDLLSEVVEWAKAKGLVSEGECFAFHSTDDDGNWRFATFATLEEAMGEASVDDDYETPEDVPGPDGRPGVERMTRLVASPALASATGMRFEAGEDATDASVVAWAKAEASNECGRDVDGVWWREIMAPETLSAPRGCVFPSRVVAWDSKVVDALDIDDDYEVARFPEPAVAGIGMVL